MSFSKWFGRATKKYVLPLAEQAAKDELTQLAARHGYGAVLDAATSYKKALSTLESRNEGFNHG